jgi:hypothetical protein
VHPTGKVVCFFQSAQKFNTRYAIFGFSDKANLDEGALWPVAFTLKELTATVEARRVALVKKAVICGLISPQGRGRARWTRLQHAMCGFAAPLIDEAAVWLSRR